MIALLLAAAATSPQAAAGTVQRYYALIAAHRYEAARQLWDHGGQASGQSPAAFARGFARTVATAVRTGPPGRAEGAAGSVYVTVPVRVEARLADGTRQHFTGRYVLRRVNGAAAGPRGWHIASARLRPARGA